jgi:hypothetical protein
MTYPTPVYVGRFDPVRAGDIVDLYIDITADLADGETVSSCAFTVTDSAAATVANVVTGHTETAARTDFRIAAPATVGNYQIAAVFTISDGQKLTRTAAIRVV